MEPTERVERYTLGVWCTACGHTWQQHWQPSSTLAAYGLEDHPWFLPCPRCGLQYGYAEDPREPGGSGPDPERTVVDSPGDRSGEADNANSQES